MPITTALNTVIGQLNPPPQIQITVYNGGGTNGDPALITLTVVWDPNVMSFGNVLSPLARVSHTESSVTWRDYGIAWGAHRDFVLVLWRKNGNTSDTFVIASPTDARSGDFDTQSWQVPPTHPQEP
jgi:hypothetical protein